MDSKIISSVLQFSFVSLSKVSHYNMRHENVPKNNAFDSVISLLAGNVLLIHFYKNYKKRFGVGRN